ncbi:methyltransferase family protein [Murinocardiopsis flavida]|uniref:Methyltransferase family protein n=1 Tax=Murinocardiopsis flavida TaxID=645275 RepID=A0A2P8D6V8_9ACTN|nr:class I SAM-dependent methyltransferase [Murinocardiopsis flavida]PSK92953.1 methyltransferase family protein [Murinocardiopsis flavida]
MSLAEVRDDWTRLGTDDPLWAILSHADKRGGQWDEREFLETGRTEIDAAVAWLDRLGVRPATERALDFGCGAGRLSIALTDHFAEVVGIDIAEPMLVHARRLDCAGQVRYLHNTRPDLACLQTGTIDFCYSNLVLQHMPPELAAGYLREFLRVLRPGGAVVVGIPDLYRRSAVGLLSRFTPRPLARLVQRHVLGYPAPMRMHTMPGDAVRALAAANGARVVAAEEFDNDPHWRHMRYVIVKNAPGGR